MTTIWIIGVGVVCFIAGMILELIINASEINDIKAQLEHVKNKNQKLETVEVIEINDNVALNKEAESIFDPW